MPICAIIRRSKNKESEYESYSFFIRHRSRYILYSQLFAEKKKLQFVRKHAKWFVLGVSLMIVGAGAVTYKNIYSLLPVIGVLIQTGAFWHDDEKKIRIMSFFGAPFWLAYNFISGAYPSCVGEFLSMVSVAIAFVRYDVLPERKKIE